MTLLQEQAVQMIRDLSDDNVVFLIEIIQRLMPPTENKERNITSTNEEKMEAFRKLNLVRNEIKNYLPQDFNPELELEEARKIKYGNID